MMNKEECEKALEHLIECKQRKLCDKCNFKLRCTMSNDELVINQLIEECFEPKENTSEFKHFKLHSDSALKNLTKNELIDYIKMLYHNWGVADEQLKRIIDKAKELSNSNDELRRQLYFIEPYNFEDLKSNMWIWDNAAKECLYVIKPFVGSFTGAKYLSYLGIYKNLEEIKKLDIKFEENRFFPVRCANLES